MLIVRELTNDETQHEFLMNGFSDVRTISTGKKY